jgi:hypothetical protein
MLKCTSGEFTLTLALLEILFPNLCLFLNINVYIKIYNRSRCICWFLRLVLGQSMCRRKFGFIFLYIFLYAFILLLLARNAFNCVHLIQWLKLVACCPNECSLVSMTSWYCWSNFEA